MGRDSRNLRTYTTIEEKLRALNNRISKTEKQNLDKTAISENIDLSDRNIIETASTGFTIEEPGAFFSHLVANVLEETTSNEIEYIISSDNYSSNKYFGGDATSTNPTDIYDGGDALLSTPVDIYNGGDATIDFEHSIENIIKEGSYIYVVRNYIIKNSSKLKDGILIENHNDELIQIKDDFGINHNLYRCLKDNGDAHYSSDIGNISSNFTFENSYDLIAYSKIINIDKNNKIITLMNNLTYDENDVLFIYGNYINI
jgi:hypothetical protein